MKKKILIISDLWGWENVNWKQEYVKRLSEYEVQLVDVEVLGSVNGNNERDIHQEFVDEGIDKAVKKLKDIKTDLILAFSIGGTIAWKAILGGMKIDKLIAVSSTRLRYEVKKPNCEIQLIYGKLDKNKPNKGWFEKMKIKENTIDGNHDLYSEKIKNISELIKVHIK